MEVVLGLILFCILLACGMPIFLVLGVGAAILFVLSGEPLISLAQKLADEPNSSTLMALPFFVMAVSLARWSTLPAPGLARFRDRSAW
jgi:C4-dicarboxylate transporter DctM subunit